jgi:hypothetical protein
VNPTRNANPCHVAWRMIGTSLIGSFGATAWIGWQLYDFNRLTSDLPPGSWVRPMGLAAHLVLAGYGSIFIFGILAIFGIIRGMQCSHRLPLIVAVFALPWSGIPLVGGWIGFDQIIATRGLLLSD